MGIFFLQTSSVIFLLIVASGVTYAAKLWKIPATVLLVAMGLLIGFMAEHNILPFMDDFELNSDILFYILLPILLFESAYNIRYTDLLKNIYAITTLSIVSLFISAFVVAILLYYVLGFIGLPIPFIITLLFGALISATDTAAALSIFKNIGVPKRLNIIFEGESLFNDGTAIAFFIVVLSLVESQATGGVGINHMNLYEHFIEGFSLSLGSWYPLLNGFISLGSMIGFGILIGGSIGILFSKIIQKIQNETYLEITLSLALAHATFLLAEFINHFFVPVSGIIATVAAAMILGNYGRYKISPKVEEVMEKYWGFFTFLSNNLVFILVGMLLIQLDVNWRPLILPMLCAIPIVVFARFVSVYPVFGFLNFLKKEEKVPASWQFILSLGALRGGIAVMLVLLIPKELVLPTWENPMGIRDVLLSLTIGVVIFSIFINTLTLAPLIKKLGIDTLSELEKLQYLKAKMYLFHNSLSKIIKIREGRYIDAEEGQMLIDEYQKIIKETQKDIELYQKEHAKNFSALIKRVFALHALAVEEQALLRLYKKNEVNESVFKKIIERIRLQIDDLEKGQKKIQGTKYIKVKKRKIERFSSYIVTYIEKETPAIFEKYYEVRTLHVITEKALESLKILREVEFLSHYSELQEVLNDYEVFDEDAENTRRQLFKAHRDTLRKLSGELTKKSLLADEEESIEALGASNIISEKIVSKLEKELSGKL